MVPTYFSRIAEHNSGFITAFANNGWIWNADPLKNFVEHGEAYFLRELIVWGDCIKLRYGDCESASPWLWNYMSEYTELMASIFDGFRIDNCHSTPLHVAEYMLRCARAVNPNIYVVAELFTSSPSIDLLFVTRLGINSLIREAMAAWCPQELCRVIDEEYGGLKLGQTDSQFYFHRPHVLFMDCTHDNLTPNEKRTGEDALPNAAIVSFASECAVGSVRGYDELIKNHLDIVKDSRLYPDANNRIHEIGICKGTFLR